MRHGLIFACAILILASTVGDAIAQSPVKSEKTITLQAALKIAQVALEKSHANGANNVAIVVTDSAARVLVLLRDDNATEHPALAATRKAWTAANYRSSTKDVLARIKEDNGDDGQLVYTAKSLFLMGGVPLRDGEDVVGAVGVAGNPSGFQDDAVAAAAADAFKKLLSDNQ
jgi:uncharacterized protein GlcG (DUF336 family)